MPLTEQLTLGARYTIFQRDMSADASALAGRRSQRPPVDSEIYFL